MSRNSNTRTTTPTTIPGIPKPPADISPSLKAYLEAVSEALEVRLGRRGDPRDRAITLRELINSGLAQDLRNRPFNPNATGPNTLDFLNPDADQAVPPQPTGFSASGGYSLIQLYWDYPRYGNHSLTEIWRHDSDVIGDAQLVGVASGLAYVDAVGEGQSYYYWIRHVSTTGVPGPFNAAAGTLAETAPNVDLLLDELTDAITQSQLDIALRTQINNAATASDLADLESFAGYVDGYTGSDLLSQINSAVASISVNAGDILAIEGDVTSLQTSVTSLNGTVSTNSSAISALTTRVTAAEGSISVNSTDITALDTSLTNLSTSVSGNSTAISALSSTVTTQGGLITANSNDITALENTVNNPTTGVAATSLALSSLSSTVTAQGNSITANANDISALGVTVTNNTSGITANSTNITSLTSTVTSQGGDISALSSSLSTLSTTVGSNTTSISTQATSINGLEAQYTVKVDTNGYVSGFGLASTSTGATPTSEFIVNADRFAIGSPSGLTEITPFIVQTTPTTLNGVSVPTGVYISEAYIRNGAIANAKIGDAAIDNAKIASLAVTGAKIDDATITGAKIIDGEISNAKIGNAAITNAKILDATITGAKIGTAQIDTLQLAGESVIVPVADTFSGTIASSWPTVRTYLNGLPNPSITLSVTTEVLVLWGVRFLGQSSGAGDMLVRIKEGSTTIFSMGGTPQALSTGGFIGGAIRRSKTAGTYTYYMEWSAFNSPLYEAYIILLGIQR